MSQDHSARFANKCTEAALGYANAGLSAGLHATTAAVEAWSRAYQDAVDPARAKPSSWFQHPDTQTSAVSSYTSPTVSLPWSMPTPWPLQNWMMAMFTPPTNQTMPWPAMPLTEASWGQFAPSATDMMSLASSWSPFSASQSAWAMTWSLMAIGVPHAVAKPTAEANAATMEAFESAQHAARESLTFDTPTTKTRRSASKREPRAAAPANPFAVFWPWLDLPAVNR